MSKTRRATQPKADLLQSTTRHDSDSSPDSESRLRPPTRPFVTYPHVSLPARRLCLHWVFHVAQVDFCRVKRIWHFTFSIFNSHLLTAALHNREIPLHICAINRIYWNLICPAVHPNLIFIPFAFVFSTCRAALANLQPALAMDPFLLWTSWNDNRLASISAPQITELVIQSR